MKQVSYVQLSNPATRPLIYTARLDGPVDFSLDAQEVKLGPKASQKLPIMCTPPTTKPQVGILSQPHDRLSTYQAQGLARGLLEQRPLQHPTHCKCWSQAGYLILTSDKGSHLPASTLVFALQSVLDTRTPLAIFHCTGALYELADFDVSVTNPFNLDCDFSLTILNASPDQLDADMTMPRGHAE